MPKSGSRFDIGSWPLRKTWLTAFAEKAEILCLTVQQARDRRMAISLPWQMIPNLKTPEMNIDDVLAVVEGMSIKQEIFKALEVQVEAKLSLARVEVDMVQICDAIKEEWSATLEAVRNAQRIHNWLDGGNSTYLGSPTWNAWKRWRSYSPSTNAQNLPETQNTTYEKWF